MLGKVLGVVQRPISLDMRVIMDNMNLMTQNQEEDEDERDNSFRMPMYKYLEMQEDIVQEPILEEFNTTFPVNYQINLEITIE